jgi:hypothetical protein
MTDEITLPPLPEGVACATCGEEPFYGHNHMRDYARAAILLDRQQRAAPSAERDTRPCWGVPHAGMIRCLDAAIDRLHAGDTPEEVFADFGWSLTVPPDHFAVMRQALDALEERYVGALRDSAIDALRAALEPKQC